MSFSLIHPSSTNNENIIEETDEIYDFPSHAIHAGRDNVVTIVLDNMGLDMSGKHPDESKSPRGIRGASINGEVELKWKVQGKAGGYQR
jgi:N-acetyl-beta-hexosaminidase